MKNILIIYYTQSGQLTNITDSIFSELENSPNVNIDYYKIQPVEDYPFPWDSTSFYDVMPESVKGIACKIKEPDIDYKKKYDLVVLAYQVWFLSPSIPFWSFLQNKKVQLFLQNKKVITILGVRNMWVNAQKRIKKEFDKIGVDYVGNIVMADKNNNILGVILVIKFAYTGNFKPYKHLPRYGVPEKDIKSAKIFGNFIKEALISNDFSQLQQKIIDHDGVYLRFSLRTTELVAGKFFVKWADFILKKGEAKKTNRAFRLNLFKNYLMILIFLISPVSTTIFEIISILFYPFVKKSLNKTKLLKF